MAKNNSIENESWDSGTYQTGSTKEGKGQNGLITGLLIAVIFLGGLASALGLMNFKLLTQLMNQQSQALPLSVDATAGTVSNYNREYQSGTPVLPDNRELTLTVGGNTAVVSAEEILNQPSLVELTVKTSHGRLRTGPALVLSSDGYLLTNAHLTEDARYLTVQLSNGEAYSAILVATDTYSDLSVLYIQARGLTAAVFSGDTLVPGKQAYALVQCDTLSQGKVFADFRQLIVGADTLSLQQTDFDADHGPVFDDRGQVIGFLCRYFGEEGEGQLLSASQLMNIAVQLTRQGAVSGRPCLGLQARELSSFFRQYWNLSGGLEITTLLEGAAAQNAGLMKGDILLRINGKLLTELSQLHGALCAAEAGQTLQLEIFRAGQHFTVTLPVKQHP